MLDDRPFICGHFGVGPMSFGQFLWSPGQDIAAQLELLNQRKWCKISNMCMKPKYILPKNVSIHFVMVDHSSPVILALVPSNFVNFCGVQGNLKELNFVSMDKYQ